MTTIINGSSPSITFSDATTQNTAGLTGSSSQLVKAWVNYNASTQTIINSYNVSSVTYISSGNYTVNYTNALATANNCIALAASGDGGPAYIDLYGAAGTNTTTGVRISTQNGNHFSTNVAVFA
jgi:hypothetical protein